VPEAVRFLRFHGRQFTNREPLYQGILKHPAGRPRGIPEPEGAVKTLGGQPHQRFSLGIEGFDFLLAA